MGLSYIDEHVPCDAVLIMDADGEDRVEDIPSLLRRFDEEGQARIVFAERTRRAEGLLFRLLYLAYRLLHRLLTGGSVRIGNFSVAPMRRVRSLVVVSELWIHYAAAAVRSRQPMCSVPTGRGRRLDGRSRMSFVSLVVHGLSAISVYSDVVFTRLIVATSTLSAAAVIGLLAVAMVRLFTTLAIPGWATFTAGLLLVLMVQAVMFAAGLTFQVLGSRQHLSVIPRRDYATFVLGIDLASKRPRA